MSKEKKQMEERAMRGHEWLQHRKVNSQDEVTLLLNWLCVCNSDLQRMKRMGYGICNYRQLANLGATRMLTCLLASRLHDRQPEKVWQIALNDVCYISDMLHSHRHLSGITHSVESIM